MAVNVTNLNIRGRTIIGVNPITTPGIVTNGLVLYLDAGNRQSYPGSGTTWTDLSGNGNNGILTNGPTFSTMNGGTIVFDGANDYISLSNFSGVITSNFTYIGWVYIGTLQPDINVIIGNRPGGPQDGFFFHINGYLNSSRQLGVEIWTPSTTYLGVGSSNSVIVDNSWNYVAFVANRTSSQGIVYHNTNRYIGTIPSFQLNNTAWRIGIATGDNFRLKGNIPIAMLYNRALSQEEVLQNYNATKSRFI